MTFHTVTVCESIAALNVDGVKIKDLAHVPPDATRLTPILFPNPDDTLSNLTPERMSMGGGSSALIDVDYDLNYIFLFCPIGSGRTGLDYHGERMAKVNAIWDAILSIDILDGAVDIMPTGNVSFATVQDPARNEYLGCFLTVHVKEFWR